MSYLRNGSIHLRRGTEGNPVKYIQERLGIQMDGNFGRHTDAAVRSFQRRNGLTVDGIIGPITFVVLMTGDLVITFDRINQKLTVRLEVTRYGISKIFECSAVSGLPRDHPRTRQLIREGRSELSRRVDYMDIRHEDVADVGPIPDRTYELELRPNMPFDESGGGWGFGGWYLDPGTWLRFSYRFGLGARGGFFLHQDGNGIGTGDCIGVSRIRDMRKLQEILIKYQSTHSKTSIDIVVT